MTWDDVNLIQIQKGKSHNERLCDTSHSMHKYSYHCQTIGKLLFYLDLPGRHERGVKMNIYIFLHAHSTKVKP